MKRIINIVIFLLVLLHVISMLCGCSVDGGQEGIHPQTPVTTAEETMTGTTDTPSVIYTPYDFRSPDKMLALIQSFKIRTPVEHEGAEDKQQIQIIVDQEKLDAFAASIGMSELADLDALGDLYHAFASLSAPDLGTDLIEGMIWDANVDTLTFVYQTVQDDGLMEYALLTHERSADADAVRAELDTDGTVTPMFLNKTADAVYLHRDDAEALEVTVIWNTQVMRLTVFGDDAELRMAYLADADFSVTADTLLGDPYKRNLWEPGQYAHKKVEYKSLTAISRLFETQDMTDDEYLAWTNRGKNQDSGILASTLDAEEQQRLISSRAETEDIIAMLSPVRVPMIGETEPSAYLVCTEADVRTVECSFSVGGNVTAVVTYDLRDPDAMDAVTRLWRSRCTNGDWLSVGDHLWCTLIDGMFIRASINDFADFGIEDITFGQTIAECIQ